MTPLNGSSTLSSNLPVGDWDELDTYTAVPGMPKARRAADMDVYNLVRDAAWWVQHPMKRTCE